MLNVKNLKYSESIQSEAKINNRNDSDRIFSTFFIFFSPQKQTDLFIANAIHGVF